MHKGIVPGSTDMAGEARPALFRVMPWLEADRTQRMGPHMLLPFGHCHFPEYSTSNWIVSLTAEGAVVSAGRVQGAPRPVAGSPVACR